MNRGASSGKMQSFSPTSEQKAAKRAFERVVQDCGGLEKADLECRVSASQLQRYCSPNIDAFPTLDVIRDLEAIAATRADGPHVTSYLARHAGYVLIERPKVDAPDCASLHVALTASMKESNESHVAMMEALGTGTVTAAQARACMKEAIEAAEEHLRLHALLKRIAEEC